MNIPEAELLRLKARARSCMERYGNCAQAAFLALRECFGLEDCGLFRALTPLPGIGHRGETCGAVSGSLLILGLLFGRDEEGDEGKEKTAMQAAGRFCRRFSENNSSTVCNDILLQKLGKTFDFTNEEEILRYSELGGREVCKAVVENAVTIAAEVINEMKDPQARSGFSNR